MSSARVDPNRVARPALLFGAATAFVAAVDLVRELRPRLLLDAEPGWAAPRLLLGLTVVAGAAAAAALAAAVFHRLTRTSLISGALEPLPFGARAALGIAVVALGLGVVARVVCVRSLTIPYLEDEVNLVAPSLALTGTARDFSDSIRPIPYGRPDPHEMVGVAYLRLLRRSLELFGATPFAVRAPSLLGGLLSLFTAALLAGALLPRGGAALAALALAGLRWHLILSFSGWHSILLAPLVDLAALLLVAARRRGGPWRAVLAGALSGVGAHLYLAAWAAAAGLAAFAAWPGERAELARARVARTLLFAAGFALLAAPLFLLAEGRRIPYFGRTSRHSVVREMRIAGSPLPLFSAAADAIPAPWVLPDPEGRHDLAGASRLGWILGIPVAVALARALVSPRSELSGLLLSAALAAFAAAVAGGQAGHPNGFRFGYLSTFAAVAAAAGCLAVVGAFPIAARGPAAFAVVGLLAISGARGLRQAAVEWPSHPATFASFHGEDTLIGTAAARWKALGPVRVAPGLGRSDATIETVARYRLGDRGRPVSPPPALHDSARRFRIEPPAVVPEPGERIVERVRDPWGREWAIVLGRKSEPS